MRVGKAYECPRGTTMATESDEATTPSRGQRNPRRIGLRGQWTAVFACLLVLVVGSGTASLVALSKVVGQFADAGARLRTEAEFVASVNQQINAHEGQAHGVMDGAPIPAEKFLADQAELERLFAKGLRILPAGRQRATLRAARDAWIASLTQAGQWDKAAPLPDAVRDPIHAALGRQTGEVAGSLDAIDAESRRMMGVQLAQAEGLKTRVTLGLSVFFILALTTILYAARRTSRDVLEPVTALSSAAERLRAGDLTHRVQLKSRVGRNEMSDLAETFNDMAAALDDSHQSLNYQAMHDSLTKLPNRVPLQRRMSESFAPGTERRRRHESVLFIDVDDFKTVNDSLGHARGDELLVQVAGRLRGRIRSHDMVARLGGDEFAIVVSEDENGAMATVVARRVLDAFAVPFLVDGHALAVTASIGIAIRTPEVPDVDTLLAQADFAMYMAKGHGKSRFEVFDSHMHAMTTEHANLRTELRDAVDADQLVLHYQPIYDLEHDKLVGVEALVRWQHPTRGLLAPVEFIPAAEETGVIDALGVWVLETALAQVQTWRAEFPEREDMWVSVNVSPLQLRNPQSVAGICDIIAASSIPSYAVVLEITESTLVAEVEGGMEALLALKRSGIRLALDDFGTGMSSLGTLQQSPVDIIKIDRSFVSGDGLGLASEALVETVMGLATKLGLDVIAEGIEQPQQQTALRMLNCRLGQGYALTRPASPESVHALLTTLHREHAGQLQQATSDPT